jgi:hypothetical protein
LTEINAAGFGWAHTGVMRKMILLATASLLVLSGCATQRFAEQKAAFDAAAAQCRETRVRTGGSYVSYAHCVNAASEQFGASDPTGPLIRATRLSLAAKVDRHEMTPEDAGAELARVAFEARQQVARTGAAVAAGQGSAMQGTAAMLNATKPPPTPSPIQTNCLAAGPSLSCTSY